MSTKTKKAGKAPATGVRYTDAQKQEIVAFVTQYNADNGRGGQSAASAKYNVTPLTISGWLKAAGVKGPKAAKAAKASKAPKAPKAPKAAKAPKADKGGKGKKGVRYPQEYKQKVVDFVESYNAKNGRGGQNQAASKFNISVLTVSAWLKAAGATKPSSTKTTAQAAKAPKTAAKATKVAAKTVGKDLAAFKAELLNLIKRF